MRVWLAYVLLVSPMAVGAAVVAGGCDGDNDYGDLYTCTAPFTDRYDAFGRYDPCCETEPACIPVFSLDGDKCECMTPCMEDPKDRTNLAMECIPDDAGAYQCDCYRSGAVVGSCQQNIELVCKIHLSCCHAHLTW